MGRNREHIVSLRLNGQQYAELLERAKKNGVTVSEFIRREVFAASEKPIYYTPVTHTNSYTVTQNEGHFVYWNMP